MVGASYILLLAALFLIPTCTISQLSNNKTELLNWCLKSKNHKAKPGKEDSLHNQCTPWKDHACCTEDVTLAIHNTDIYNFTLDHCFEQTDRQMSDGCRRHFIQDNCFYECEPSIGLWVVKTNRTITQERFYKVPLCQDDCDSWFEDCKDDYTCVQNWPRDFKFRKGHNYCPLNSKCLKFKDIYSSSKDFCEKVWDYSWEYTTHPRACMHVWFNGTNPNVETAEIYYKARFESGAATVNALNYIMHILLPIAILYFI